MSESIILSTNFDKGYYDRKPSTCISSIVKNSDKDMKVHLMSMGFSLDKSDSYTSTNIPRDSLGHSSNRYVTGRRTGFSCLETGEFVNFLDFKDSDILVLCDYDVTMQRKFNKNEKDSLFNLGELDFAANLDSYNSKEGKISTFVQKFSSDKNVFKDLKSEYNVFNTGVQAGRLSAWKNLYKNWSENSEKVNKSIPYHFSFQLYFSYFIQHNNIATVMPETFHNASWFLNTRSTIRENKLFVDDNLVLFNHHKWAYRAEF